MFLSTYISVPLWPYSSTNRAQVDSPQSLENVETKWKNEIEENCPGVRIVLVALKCDLRENNDDEETNEPKRPLIEYKQGLQVAQNIKALRYLGKSPISLSDTYADRV
jgi:GTPase SAR1 family protein